jgi:hypothetical protein
LAGVSAAVMTKRLVQSLPFGGGPRNPWGRGVHGETDVPGQRRAP